MRGILGFAAFAAALPISPAGAQFHGGTPLEQAAAAYGKCVYERARASKRSGASADTAIASGFSLCKSGRKRALNATRSRMVGAGLPAASAKSTAQSMIDSGDRMMADSLRREFAGPQASDPGAPK
ncbi:MAG TPA: hypothetical protein VF782_15215 [Allosphingosinicella sp.]|jgi:hypothetical protein